MRTKYRSYVIKKIQNPTDKLESLVTGVQNVYYIVSSFMLGYLFARTENLLFAFALLVPILIKIGWNRQNRRIEFRLIR